MQCLPSSTVCKAERGRSVVRPDFGLRFSTLGDRPPTWCPPAQSSGLQLQAARHTNRVTGPLRAATAEATERLAFGSQSQFDEHGDDYYSILGVLPSAPQSVIKNSYYKTIRECHPDLTGVEEDTATEFCIFLNEIYEVRVPPLLLISLLLLNARVQRGEVLCSAYGTSRCLRSSVKCDAA